jgi:L-threonylcarbamoyladenylate synthase
MKVLSISNMGVEKITSKTKRALEKGGAVVYPTDTIYGLGTDATKDDCVENIYRIKHRSHENPLSIMVSDFKMLRRYAKFSAEQCTLMREILPGKFTVVLQQTAGLADNLSDSGTMGFRIPSSEIALGICSTFSKPVVTTSANISGEPVPDNIDDIIKVFGDEVDLYVDGGHSISTEPSTVVDLTSSLPRIIRKGADYEKLHDLLMARNL